MDVLGKIRQILAEIFDVEEGDISPETYLVRDLGSESIDFLELTIALNSRFEIAVNEDDVFLKRIGRYLNEARQHGKGPVEYIGAMLPFLSEVRIKEIVKDMKGMAPPLKVKDLVSYVEWQRNRQ